MNDNNSNETQAFVLLSGGIDSAVCLKKASEEHDSVAAIHIDYGQQTEEIERANAEKQADDLGVSLYTSNYRAVFSEFAEGTIEDKEYDRERTTDDDHSVGYVPQRNLSTSQSWLCEGAAWWIDGGQPSSQ
ncbi:7-cyano-7-deazaguanine synthase (plasmid) [Halococcus dombrowskii]|uniref:7-cyano-7-deazaguanine synthase n=1 Tax=Halococcus dombrowskii TaxID=179637 RepID=A0AAX3AV97_HALDO|nr:7-cyano-7-deazaguanine synthase [Halococcus dombrowskii]UOO97400.1 7-cyano-7-deazaguanine synthase [Halococcus dombrowskii]